MRAMVFDRYGDPDVMRLRDLPVPEPQDGEVLIRVGYAGVNPADYKARAGHGARAGYRYREVYFPFATGLDAAGVVERTGANVNEFRPGDRVITWSAADGKTWGSYAEFLRVSARDVSPMPMSRTAPYSSAPQCEASVAEPLRVTVTSVPELTSETAAALFVYAENPVFQSCRISR
jgi:NADPH:quinone reductase-like Zn-dependent oxidoreductase